MSKNETTATNLEIKVPDAFKKLSSKMHDTRPSSNSETRNPHSKHVIVRMTQVNGKIIRMFGWYLMKGTNITSINELSALEQGDYFIDIIDQEGNILFTTPVQK
jgi:hypothetical protein